MTALPTLHLFQEVAEQYRCSLRSLTDRAYRREFDHVRIGNQRYFTDEQLRAFLAQSTVLSRRAADLAATKARVAARRRRAAARQAAA